MDYKSQQEFHGKRVEARAAINNTPMGPAQPEGDYWLGHAVDSLTESDVADDLQAKLGLGADEITAIMPSHGGYPSPADTARLGLDHMSAAADEGRMIRVGDHDPEPAAFKRADQTGWPSIYFDAVRASIALEDIAKGAREEQIRLKAAMQTLRVNNASPKSIEHLTAVYNDVTAASDVRIQMAVNELSDTIESWYDAQPSSGPVTLICRIRGLVSKLKSLLV